MNQSRFWQRYFLDNWSQEGYLEKDPMSFEIMTLLSPIQTFSQVLAVNLGDSIGFLLAVKSKLGRSFTGNVTF